MEKNFCELVGSETHNELAQLILWREDSENLHNHSLFRVEIIGSSAPVTYALLSIFMDQEQIKLCFGNQDDDKEEQEFLLCKLQTADQKIYGCFFDKTSRELE